MQLKEFTTHFLADEYLFHEGDEGNCAYIIETGSIEVSVNKAGRKLVIATLGKGDLLGEMAIIDKLPRTATAVALEDARVVAIPLDYIHQKIEYSDPTVRFFLQIIMERYRDMHARLMHVFEGISPPEDDTYEALYATTTNVVRQLMNQYLNMQDRILSAVNTSVDLQKKKIDGPTADNTKRLLAAEQALRQAISNDEFQLHYQPVISLDSEKIIGCEALVRWLHPDKGMIPPGEFIPQAESFGLIGELGYWIAETACRFQHRLAQRSSNPIFVSINLSGKQFEDPQLIPNLKAILVRTGATPEMIKYEITESLLMANPELANDLLNQLRESGARLAIDDFGTGYSSFSYLHRFPFDTLKIDRAFVSTMVQNRKSLQIVKSLINLSHDIGMDVIAEGIETIYEADLLTEYGAEYGQGFHYSRPVGEAEFKKLLD